MPTHLTSFVKLLDFCYGTNSNLLKWKNTIFASLIQYPRGVNQTQESKQNINNLFAFAAEQRPKIQVSLNEAFKS